MNVGKVLKDIFNDNELELDRDSYTTPRVFMHNLITVTYPHLFWWRLIDSI